MAPEPTPTISDADELLERSVDLGVLEDRLATVRATGRGRLVVIAGEAGIGKTALVRAFCEGGHSARVLWGACDALYTPRPLGPLLDIAQEEGGELAALDGEGATPGALVEALARRILGAALTSTRWGRRRPIDATHQYSCR